MTDRYKGFLITLEKEIRDDDAKSIIQALKMIKGVQFVTPYIKGIEDCMAEEKGRHDAFLEMHTFFLEKRTRTGE